MRVTGIDERRMTAERTRSDFVVFFYETPVRADASWSVDSYLVEDATMPEVLAWLEEHLPDGCCWSLGGRAGRRWWWARRGPQGRGHVDTE